MKKQFKILTVSAITISLFLSLIGAVLISQTVFAKKGQNSQGQINKPIPASDMKIVKKVFAGEDLKGIKGKPPFPPGQEIEEGVASGILGEQLSPGADKYAVIIGICDYPGTVNDLCVSDGDSLNTYKALTTLYGYHPDNIHLLKDMGGETGFIVNPITGEKKIAEVPTYDNIEYAVMDIKNNPNLTSDDEVVFFFSGHGGWLRDEYGNPIDVYPFDETMIDGRDEVILVHDDDANSVGILDDTLKDWFTGFKTKRIVFIFDTCLAGGMNDVQADGRVVVMATDETHSASVYSTGTYDIDGDGINDGEGVFTHFFVNEGMLQGYADKHYEGGNHDGDVVVEEAFDYAKENIPPRLRRKQIPTISDMFTNDLLL